MQNEVVTTILTCSWHCHKLSGSVSVHHKYASLEVTVSPRISLEIYVHLNKEESEGKNLRFWRYVIFCQVVFLVQKSVKQCSKLPFCLHWIWSVTRNLTFQLTPNTALVRTRSHCSKYLANPRIVKSIK